MDFLSRLPDLILVNIFGLMHSERDIFHLISASPHFLSIYTHYRHSITRQRLSTILELDVDGSLLQDAQAVIDFPVFWGDSGCPYWAKESIDTWNARGYPNPLMEEGNPESITCLYHFFARLIFFIEDYLSKAADPFPTRAYMTLPTLSRLAPTMRFKGQDIDIKHVPFNDLSQSGRRRLLQAFVRFELRCKVHHPCVRSLVKGTAYEDMIHRADKRLTMEEHEEIHYVGEYLRAIYGAIIAQSDSDIWFPDRPAPTTTAIDELLDDKQQELPHANDRGLLFPDNHYIGLPTYISDAYLMYDTWVRMPCLGLDPLSSLLQYINSDSISNEDIRHRVRCISDHEPYGCWTASGSFARRHRLYSISADVDQWATEARFSNNREETGIEPSMTEVDRLTSLQISATGMYRQRAMTFFTGSTSQPILPCWNNFVSQEERVGDIVDLQKYQRRRRSQVWQDYWAGRTVDRPVDEGPYDYNYQDGMDYTVGGNNGDYWSQVYEDYMGTRFFERPRLNREIEEYEEY
ncbi:hypothetical protein HYE68_003962 [Fusarium pseudograminearum]|nr:hypothetical protein HYE68_003962 [Fusarium pseudograminearum]